MLRVSSVRSESERHQNAPLSIVLQAEGFGSWSWSGDALQKGRRIAEPRPIMGKVARRGAGPPEELDWRVDWKPNGVFNNDFSMLYEQQRFSWQDFSAWIMIKCWGPSADPTGKWFQNCAKKNIWNCKKTTCALLQSNSRKEWFRSNSPADVNRSKHRGFNESAASSLDFHTGLWHKYFKWRADLTQVQSLEKSSSVEKAHRKLPSETSRDCSTWVSGLSPEIALERESCTWTDIISSALMWELNKARLRHNAVVGTVYHCRHCFQKQQAWFKGLRVGTPVLRLLWLAYRFACQRSVYIYSPKFTQPTIWFLDVDFRVEQHECFKDVGLGRGNFESCSGNGRCRRKQGGKGPSWIAGSSFRLLRHSRQFTACIPILISPLLWGAGKWSCVVGRDYNMIRTSESAYPTPMSLVFSSGEDSRRFLSKLWRHLFTSACAKGSDDGKKCRLVNNCQKDRHIYTQSLQGIESWGINWRSGMGRML